MITRLKRELFEPKHGKPEQFQLELQIAELEEQLARRNQILFGSSSEKPSPNESKKATAKKQTGHGCRDQPELELEVHVGETRELCGGDLRASEGFFEESEEVDIIERRF